MKIWNLKESKKVKVTQSCPTLCNPMDYIVHGILQARILDWVAILFSRGIFPTQGSNPGLSHCRWTLCQLSHKVSPKEKNVKVKVRSLSDIWLFATQWTVAYQTPLSVEFSRQEYWSGCRFLLQGIFPTQGSNPGLPHFRQTLHCLSHKVSPREKQVTDHMFSVSHYNR